MIFGLATDGERRHLLGAWTPLYRRAARTNHVSETIRLT
jgi:hypothetical protein